MLPGLAGALEAVLDAPLAPTALAMVCHPHPPDGGTMNHEVPMANSRELARLSCAVLRFNFRGVGQSEGAYDRGVGETDDALASANWLRARKPGLPLTLAGLSFGAAVVTLAAARLDPPPERLILAGTSPERVGAPPVSVPTLVVHGEQDEIVPLINVLDWARPQMLPVTVVPGVGHFFHGELPLLQSLVRQFWLASVAPLAS
jgi:alpha/beta superfamily hydrolase